MKSGSMKEKQGAMPMAEIWSGGPQYGIMDTRSSAAAVIADRTAYNVGYGIAAEIVVWNGGGQQGASGGSRIF